MSSSVESPGVCFTFTPDRSEEWPKPFAAASRSVLLCHRPDPKVLILGYGLGAMGARMAELKPAARIHGVELSKKLFLGARDGLPPRAKLVLGDARAFLLNTRQRFDLILDDCFELIDGDARRPPELKRHASLARKRLEKSGIYIRNHLPEGGRFKRQQIADIDQCFVEVRLRRFLDWDNILVVASDKPLDRPAIRRL